MFFYASFTHDVFWFVFAIWNIIVAMDLESERKEY